MQGPGPDSRIVYIDGAFDLLHAGHVEVNVNSFAHAHPPEMGKERKKSSHLFQLSLFRTQMPVLAVLLFLQGEN